MGTVKLFTREDVQENNRIQLNERQQYFGESSRFQALAKYLVNPRETEFRSTHAIVHILMNT